MYVILTAEGANTLETLRQKEHKKLTIWRAVFLPTEGVSFNGQSSGFHDRWV